MSVDTSHVLAFVSGITMVPPLGFQNPQPKMYFTDSVVATASTCDISVHVIYQYTFHAAMQTTSALKNL